MSTLERIQTLANGGHELHIIAAILDLEPSVVAEALAEGIEPVVPGGGGEANGLWLPEDLGFLAWNFDMNRATERRPVAAGETAASEIKLPGTTTISYVTLMLTGLAEVELTPGGNFIGLYDGTRKLIGQTGDQSEAWASTEPARVTAALEAPATASGIIYAAVLANGGATLPSFACVELLEAAAREGADRRAIDIAGPNELLPEELSGGVISTQSIWFALS